MKYEYLNNNDIGFRLIDNKSHPNPNSRLNQLPYVFKRSEIENAMRVSPLQILYLRNKTRAQDYEIMFKSTENLIRFLKLFPKAINDDSKTADYYSMPCWSQY